MRTRYASVVSVGGVIAAGLVAALVNTQALAGAGGRAESSLAVTPLVPASVSPGSDGMAREFSVGKAGTITLGVANGALTVIAIAPQSGWSVSAMASSVDGSVFVDFVSADTQLQATATLSGSQITVSLAEFPQSIPTSTAAETPPSTPPVTPPPVTPPPVTPPAESAPSPPEPSSPATPPPPTQPQSTVRPSSTAPVPTSVPEDDDDSTGDDSDKHRDDDSETRDD